MKAAGITIDAITQQNEPFRTAGITTKIIVYDHNADHPEYATAILADNAASAFKKRYIVTKRHNKNPEQSLPL
jgi:glucosylceramidase